MFAAIRLGVSPSYCQIWNFPIFFDWSEKVLDIREQYPILEVDVVIEIADKAGILYPYDNVSGFPYVLTSDFLITTSNQEKSQTYEEENLC